MIARLTPPPTGTLACGLAQEHALAGPSMVLGAPSRSLALMLATHRSAYWLLILLGSFELLGAQGAIGQRPAAPRPATRRAERLRALALLDGALYRFHPEVATRPTAWDSIFASRVARAADAPNSGAYKAEVEAMLRALGDPQTRVLTTGAATWEATPSASGGVVVRPAHGGAGRGSTLARLRTATNVIVDLRGIADTLPEDRLAPWVAGGPLVASAQETLRYVSLPDTQYNTRLQYNRVWDLRSGESYSGSTWRPVVFLVDARSVLPTLALALRRAGTGAVIGVGTTRVRAAAATYRLDMGEDVEVAIRTGRRLVDTTGSGVPVDTSVATESKAIAAAETWSGRRVAPWPEASHDTVGVVRILPAPTTGDWGSTYPSRGYRMLAAARLWSTMHWFFPYMAEAGESWDDAFATEEPRIERAADALAYAKAIARLAWHLHDSHVRVYGRVLWRDFYGDVPASAVVQFVEGKLVVTRIADSAAARAGLAVGDEVLSVDGESVPARAARLAPYFVSSTRQALRSRITDFVLAGRDTSPARLVVRDADGRERRVAIPRSRAYPAPSYQTFRDGPIVRILPGNVGYVDLDRLTLPMVDSTLMALAGTRGIVLDGRGYPESPAWVRLSQHLYSQSPPPVAARFEEYQLASPDLSQRTTRTFTQSVFPAFPPHYSGRTALLVDERTISQAEHLGLHLRAANGTIFVGSPTMGANGGVTNVQLPGGLRVSFTGARVMHPDGQPLQRVGLQPDVTVTPTIAGIRAGRDEVLERAVACLLDEACVASAASSTAPRQR